MSLWSEQISFFWLLAEPCLPTYSVCKNAQIQVHSRRPLMRLKCARIRLWSDFLDRSNLWSDFPDRCDLWPDLQDRINHQSDLNQIMAQTILRSSNHCPDSVILFWEHTGLRSRGSDNSSIWVWTSTWLISKFTKMQVSKSQCKDLKVRTE